MRDQYYWYDHVGAGNASATNMDAYFSSLLYQAIDRYSYTQTTADFSQYYAEGTFTGYGYGLAFTDTTYTVLKLRIVEPGSPAALAGLQRGDTVLQIDGKTPLEIAAGALGRVSSTGVPRSFTVRTLSGAVRDVTIYSANFPLVPVQADQVLAQGNANVAYLSYGEFIDAGNAGLGAAFTRFVAQGATELVLDLRYNGGGSVEGARNLASMMAGNAWTGRTFVDLRYNARHPEYNETMQFSASGLQGPALQNLRRVFVITSPSTASASELVINGLRPFVSVIQIGGTTYGKPYGFEPVEACGTVYNAVNFESFNAQGVGGYTSGFTPTCSVSDDLNHVLGDPAEANLAAALYYIAHGVCPNGTGSAGLAVGVSVSAPLFIDERGLGGMRRR